MKKKIMQLTAIYLVISITVIPWYITIFRKNRDTIYNSYRNKFELGMTELEAAHVNILNLKKLIEKNQYYNELKNINDSLETTEYYLLNELHSQYSSYVNMGFKNSEAVLLFEKNDITFTKDYCFSDANLNFDKFFSFNGMSFSELKKYIFTNYDNMNKFVYDETLVVEGVTKPSIVYFLPVGKNSATGEYSCMMLVTELKTLYTTTGLEEYADCTEFAIKSTDDKLIYQSTPSFEESENTITYYFGNTDTIFMINLTNAFFDRTLPYLRFLGFFVFSSLLAAAIIIQGFTDRILRGKILSMIKELQDEDKNIKLGKEYEVVHKLITAAKNKGKRADSLDLENHFLRYFSAPILENEKEEFLKIFPRLEERYVTAIFVSANQKLTNLTHSIEAFAENNVFATADPHQNSVVFIPSKNKNEEDVKKIVKSISKHLEDDNKKAMAAIGIWCESICNGYENYQKTLSLVKYLDPGNKLIFAFDIDENSRKKDTFFKSIDSRIHSYLESGDEFNAGRLVYEHWYELLQKPYWDGRENQMLYKYCEFIESFAAERNLDLPTLEYSFETNVTEKAIMITERMTHIAKSVSNTSSDSEEVAKQIIKYIDQNFSNQLLGLLNLEDEFKIPKKKISVIIRNATGKKFTEYVEFKRVENAKKLLSTSKDDAVSISTACGFSNETSFYRSFKKLVGVTPASYRSIYFKK